MRGSSSRQAVDAQHATEERKGKKIARASAPGEEDNGRQSRIWTRILAHRVNARDGRSELRVLLLPHPSVAPQFVGRQAPKAGQPAWIDIESLPEPEKAMALEFAKANRRDA
jgi:hypothetical protein